VGNYRYTGSMKQIAADPATPAVFEAENVARILTAWARTPQPDEITRKTAWRDRRMAALQAHKRAQPKA
jgi:L-gulonate 3-dehydrogenase